MITSIIRENHDSTEGDDKAKIIDTALNLIKIDISRPEIDRSIYPSITKMINPDRQLELVPESVKLLLTPLLNSDIKVVFCGEKLI